MEGYIAIARSRLILALKVHCLEATTLPRGQLLCLEGNCSCRFSLLPTALSIPLVVGCDYNRIASAGACP